jgi:hypothetical protein
MPEAYKGSALAKARSKVAVAHRKHDPDLIVEARRDYAAEKIADYIKRQLAEAPPLSNEQRNDLAELLLPVRRRPTKDGWVAP